MWINAPFAPDKIQRRELFTFSSEEKKFKKNKIKFKKKIKKEILFLKIKKNNFKFQNDTRKIKTSYPTFFRMLKETNIYFLQD